MRYLFTTLVFMTPALIWMEQTGNIAFYLSDEVPAGQLPYILSKLFGLYALVFVLWQFLTSIINVLTNRSYLSDKWQLPSFSHKVTGLLIISLVALHLGLFFTGVTLRQGYPAWPLLLPNFKDYYHIRLTLGLLAFWSLILVAFSGLLRTLFRSSSAGIAHKLYAAAFVMIYFHALSIGSETGSGVGLLFYGLLGMTAAALMVASIYAYMRPRSST